MEEQSGTVIIAEREFEKICDELIKTKYIIFENHVDKLINTIENTTDIMNVIEYARSKFDYKEALNAAIMENEVKTVDFVMPTEDKNIVALCYGILQDVKDKRIDLEAFLNQYFLFGASPSEIYKNFGKYFIEPFYNSIRELEMRLTSEDLKANISMPEMESEKEQTALQVLKTISAEAADIVRDDPKIKLFKREEIEYYLKALDEAIAIENKLLILALANVLINVSAGVKSLRAAHSKLKQICDQL